MALSMMDQSIVKTLLESVQSQLPDNIRKNTVTFLDKRSQIAVSDYLDILREWHKRQAVGRTTVITGPVSVHWSSEDLMQILWDEAEALQIQIQSHLLESPYQHREAMARYGKSAIEHLYATGRLSPRLSCAHCVQVNEHDIELLAETGTSVIHNASSNLRLHNGIAPIDMMQQHGVNIGVGLDSMGINDDGDMLQEMRLVSALQRKSEEKITTINPMQVLEMATINGARALGMQGEIGSLVPGKKADLTILNMGKIENFDLSLEKNQLDQILSCCRKDNVDSVIIDGELVFHEGRHLKIDKAELITELLAQVKSTDASQSVTDNMIRAIKPYLYKVLNEQSS